MQSTHRTGAHTSVLANPCGMQVCAHRVTQRAQPGSCTRHTSHNSRISIAAKRQRQATSCLMSLAQTPGHAHAVRMRACRQPTISGAPVRPHRWTPAARRCPAAARPARAPRPARRPASPRAPATACAQRCVVAGGTHVWTIEVCNLHSLPALALVYIPSNSTGDHPAHSAVAVASATLCALVPPQGPLSAGVAR